MSALITWYLQLDDLDNIKHIACCVTQLTVQNICGTSPYFFVDSSNGGAVILSLTVLVMSLTVVFGFFFTALTMFLSSAIVVFLG